MFGEKILLQYRGLRQLSVLRRLLTGLIGLVPRTPHKGQKSTFGLNVDSAYSASM